MKYINPFSLAFIHFVVMCNCNPVTAQTDFWQQTNLKNTSVFALAVDSDGFIFAGTLGFGQGPTGVFCSTDDGETWTHTDLTDIPIYSLAIDPGGRIFAGTDRGVFRNAQTTTSVQQMPEKTLISFSLEQNYPNPFNPIVFTIAPNSASTCGSTIYQFLQHMVLPQKKIKCRTQSELNCLHVQEPGRFC